jgi:hypothetical protein
MPASACICYSSQAETLSYPVCAAARFNHAPQAHGTVDILRAQLRYH